MSENGYVVQINVSAGGVPKLPIEEGEITRLGVLGDDHHDKRGHGGPQRALCLFSYEVIEALRTEGHPIYPGAIGENLTLAGLDWGRMRPGARLRIGPNVEIEITNFTTPCETIEAAFGDGNFGRVAQQLHPGESRVYARVLSEGTVRTGDPVLWLDAEEETAGVKDTVTGPGR